ncbi:MAG TPA: penicillin-binding protein 2 [Actinomycetota bacterium]|nr:penicillin-binding protein 2 [Actinomycetota bacterium]
MTEGKSGTRLKVLALLCAFMFAALGTRLWFVQVLAGDQFKTSSVRNSTRTVDLPAPRGRILDRNGVVLARNRTSLVVTVNRQELPTDLTEQSDEIRRLAMVLGISNKEMRKRIDTKRYYEFTPVPVAFDVPKKTFFYLGEHRPEFPGVSIVEDSIRDYLDGPLAAHVLGYVGPFSPTEAADPRFAGYSQDDIVGKAGVELSYERYLQGTKGEIQYQVDSAGKNLGPVPGGTEAPVAGDDVYLTIDSDVQKLAAESLDKGMKAARTFHLPANAGAVVVLDPNSGAILAMASNPTFDPNWFATGNSREINKLFAPVPKGQQCNATGCALVDRAIQAVYPPGSTFKPFVGLSALRQGYTNLSGPKSFIPCPSTWQVPGVEPPDIKSNWEPVNLGSISLGQALAVSCDTVFYQLGWDNWVDWYNHGEHDKLQNDLRASGFGHPTGVDIPSEDTGIIPDQAYKAKAYASDPVATDRNWQPGDYINMAIGQGDVKVTPLQLATAYAALANGGTVYRPHVLEKVDTASHQPVMTDKPQVDGHLPFSKKDLTYVRNALTGVVQGNGTAVQAFTGFPLGRIPVAGKTGTAEVSPFQPYSWFAAMAPANDPQYVVVAMVEQGGHGSQSAAPIVRRILDGLFGLPLTEPATGTAKD